MLDWLPNASRLVTRISTLAAPVLSAACANFAPSTVISKVLA
nr:hypothetical protein [Simonsiella muelleri]